MIADAGTTTVAVAGMTAGVVAITTVTVDVAITADTATAGNHPQKSGALSAAFFVPVFLQCVYHTIS